MSRARSAALDAAVYILLSLYFLWPILITGSSLGIEDWDPHLLLHGAVLQSALAYQQFPFWNPWHCGGNVLWQNPQAPILTPAYLLALFTSLPVALKITVALHYLAGFAGMHLLTRHLGVTSRVWTWFIGGLFVLAGGAALHTAVGHVTFLSYFYLPWLTLFFIAALDRVSLRPAVGAAAVLALAVWNGGVYIATMSGVALGVFTVAATISRRDGRAVLLLLFVGVQAALLVAPKLLQVLIFAMDPRKIDVRYFPPGPDVLSLPLVLTSLLEPFQYRRIMLGGQKYGWHEYGNFLGAVGLFFSLASITRMLFDRRLRHWQGVSLATTAVVLLLLAWGDFAAWAPFSILRRVPLLADLRIPSRYLLVFTLFAATSVAWIAGREPLARTGETPLTRMVATALLVATAFLAYCNRGVLVGTFPYAAVEHSQFRAFPAAPSMDVETEGFSPDSPMYRGLVANRNVVRCNEPLLLPGDIDVNKPIVFSDGPADISLVRFSPNRVEFGVITKDRPIRVFMNQRYTSGWRNDAGPLEIDAATGLAYIALPAGYAGRHAFSFVPRGLLPGGIASAIGVVTAILAWRRR